MHSTAQTVAQGSVKDVVIVDACIFGPLVRRPTDVIFLTDSHFPSQASRFSSNDNS